MQLIAKLLRSRYVRWILDGEVLLELFVASNLAVLAGDIVLAHSVNQFRRPEEYIPLYFSAGNPRKSNISSSSDVRSAAACGRDCSQGKIT